MSRPRALDRPARGVALALLGLAVLGGPPAASGNAQTIITVAGGGNLGDNGPPTEASLAFPTAIAVDSAGDLLIADSANNRVRKVVTIFGVGFTATMMTTFAGTVPGSGGDGGPATSAELWYPTGIAFDSSGNVYIADRYGQKIRKVAAGTGTITTFAGTYGGSGGDGGPATSARFNSPASVAVDSARNLYIADRYNHSIRKVDGQTGIVTTVAGTGTGGFNGDGLATSAQLNSPTGVAFDGAGNLLIADQGNHRIRKLTVATETITTIVGTGTPGSSGDGGNPASAQLWYPTGVTVDSAGGLFIADSGNHKVRAVLPGRPWIFTIAGTGTAGFNGDDIAAAGAQLNSPTGVYSDLASGNLYIADRDNHRIRKMPFATRLMTTVAGNGNAGGDTGPATSAQLYFPRGVAVDSAENLFIADEYDYRVRKVDAFTGTITAVAGTGTQGLPNGDGGPATSARFDHPAGVAVDGLGNLFIADWVGDRIRKVDAFTGTITTVAGTGTPGWNGDNIPAPTAHLHSPTDVAVDGLGNLFIADRDNHRIRKVDGQTGIITTFAGTGIPGYTGDSDLGIYAQLKDPTGVAVDTVGWLYIADSGNHVIRRLPRPGAGGIITTVAGTGTPGSSGDNGPATSAQLYYPGGVAVDALGNLYIAEQSNHRIRKVDGQTGIITTFAGTGTAGFSGDGGAPTSAQLAFPGGVAVDAHGDLYIADQGNSRIRAVVSPITAASTSTVVGPIPPGMTGVSTVPTFSWSAVPGATGYRLMVITGRVWLPTDPATDTCVSCVINILLSSQSYIPPVGLLKPGTTYRWQVKAVGRGGPGPWSPVVSFSTRARMFTFTDTPLVPWTSVVMAAHVLELREAVNRRRTQFGLGAYAFTNGTLNSTIPVMAVHLTQLRAALAEAYQQVGLPAPVYGEAITARVTTVKASHLTELRTAVEALDPPTSP